MTDMNKDGIMELNDMELEAVAGGENRRVYDKSGRSNVVSAPGTAYDVMYKVRNGDMVALTGRKVVRGDMAWYELEDGGWIKESALQ